MRYPVHQWRFDLAQTMTKVVEDKQLAGMLVALTTGIRHYLSREDRRLFQQLGISHLMVISGLHIGMVADVAYVLFGFLGRFCVLLWPMMPAQFWALGGSFFAALFYAMLARFSLPIQRAKNHCRSFAALFPGDIERAVETSMVATLDKASLRADLLVVPHHGSNTSSSSKFLSVMGSSTAVVSAEYLNR